MKKNYFLLIMLLASFAGYSQIEATTYRGAFAPAPQPMWTNGWTNFDPQNAVYPTPNVNITTDITTDTRWSACNTYYLRGQIYVKNGATLTIDAGTIIRAESALVGPALIVTKGSKVFAIGTENNPIVFTSDKAIGSRSKGDWGGVIILGRGSYNINAGVNNIEGIASSADTQYGGGTTPDNNDNSGTLKYVRIEFGGYAYAANQEINGLTFGAVGRGTTVDNVQVSFANDDSFEWFGGSVNCKHLVAYRGLDDDFDTDNGFSGNVQFCLGVRDPNISDNPTVSTSEGFESDNNSTSSAATPFTSAIFSNFTLIGPSLRKGLPNAGAFATGYKRAARLRRNSQLKVFNSVFMDFEEGLFIDGVTTEANANFGASTAGAGTLKWRNNILAGTISSTNLVTSTTAANASALASWYSLNNNTTVSSSANILSLPYNTADAQSYTSLDYRPGSSSIAASGADFSDGAFNGIVQVSSPITEIEATTYRGAFAPAPQPMWTNGWTNFDPQNAVYPTPNVNITTDITTDTRWSACNTYYLRGQIYVKNGATLTIDAGTIIRAESALVGPALIVTKGSKVFAIGTENNPIVFTSDKAIGSRSKGDWGGVIILGRGSYNINAGVNNIEGIASSADTQYGGGTTPDNNDNSGTLKYVRIEFGGYAYAANQEINGLTFGAVGRGTTVDNVQVSFANDDSFEWFGGSVNCKHLVAYRGLDDDFDTDNGFSGNVQFCLGVRDPNISDNPTVSTSEGFESDNNSTSSAATPFTSAIFSNFTLIGPSLRKGLPNAGAFATGYKRAARLRRNSQLKVFNSVFMDFEEGLFIDGVTTEANANFGASTAGAGTLKWRNNILAGTISSTNLVTSTTAANASALASWYSLNNNTTVSSSANILSLPYNTADAQSYTSLDYRPGSSSIAASGADFSDGALLNVENLENKTSLEAIIYPNPSATNFKLMYNPISTDDVIVTVFDITGRVIETLKYNYAELNDSEFGHDYNAGLYLVTFKQGQAIKTLKIVKN